VNALVRPHSEGDAQRFGRLVPSEGHGHNLAHVVPFFLELHSQFDAEFVERVDDQFQPGLIDTFSVRRDFDGSVLVGHLLGNGYDSQVREPPSLLVEQPPTAIAPRAMRIKDTTAI